MKKLIIAALLIIAGCVCGPHAKFHDELSDLKDQNDVITVANRLFICTDNRDWSCVKDVFAPEVLFDMTSLTGGQP